MSTSPDGTTPVSESTNQEEDIEKPEPVEKPEPDIYNPFAPENLRLPQEVLDQIASNALLTTIPVEKPNDQDFFRCHPSEDYQYQAALITHQEEKGARYLVHPVFLKEKKIGLIKFHLEQLFLYTTRSGKLAFWPIKVRKDNRENTWLDSAEAAVEAARIKWVCVVSVPKDKMYKTAEAVGTFPEPDWLKLTQGKSVEELLAVAFKERLILHESHPLIQKLRGAV
jgi:hypothetical protein